MQIITPTTAAEFDRALSAIVNEYTLKLPPVEEGTHSRISPSKLAQIIKCPGSLQMSEDSRLPHDTTRTAADRGTDLHAVMSTLITSAFIPGDPSSGLWADAERKAAEHPEAAALSRALLATHKLLDLVPVYPDNDDDNIDDYDDYDADPVECSSCRRELVSRGYSEQRVCVSEEWDIYGTVDLWWLDSSLGIHVLDYKFGRSPVEVEDNNQLKAYALGIASMLPNYLMVYDVPQSLLGAGVNIHLHIVQPDVLGDTAATWTTSIFDLVTWWGGVVVPTLMQSTSPLGRGVLRASPDGCRWCSASPICAARDTMTQQDARKVFASLEDLSAGKLDDAEVFDLYARAGELETAVKSVKTYVRTTLARAPSHGYKLVAARGRRVWVDADSPELLDYLDTLAQDIPGFKYFKPLELLTAPALLKTYPELKRDKTLSKYIHKEPGKTLSIVLDTDPREAVTSASPFAYFLDAADPAERDGSEGD